MAIKTLPSEVINQVAAGEVVERPAHLIKELVENSLDAGATRIEVEFDLGGRSATVKDNGAGIQKEDLPLAFGRHATSKISSSSDIWSLTSFGFRGEALSSIGAVARVTLISRQQGAGECFRVISDFGKLSETQKVGGVEGTQIRVEDLFANMPARLKFLKSDTAESTQVKNVLKAMAMANPKVEFQIKTKGQLFHLWPGGQDLLERVKTVLNQERMHLAEYQLDSYRARVIYAPPNVTTGNARQIWIFCQGRWIQDRSLQAAVLDAFRGLLMHGEYPIAAVMLDCDPEDVDVNIHPSKSQVKFRQANQAFRVVHRALRESLEAAPWVETVTQPRTIVSPQPQRKFETQEANVNQSFSLPEFKKNSYAKKTMMVPETKSGMMEALKTYAPPRKEQDLQQEGLGWSQLEVIGQSNLTYILAQNSEKLIFIDQHAAHERVVYERLMAAWKGGRLDVQNFLVPLTLDLEESDIQALLELEEDLARMGVSIERLGPTSLGLTSGPALLKEAGLLRAIELLAEELAEKAGSFALEKKLGDIFATMACHSVVRAGQALSHEQMVSLLEQMDEFPLSSFCPHGRPVFVEYPFSRLERDFGRIV